MKLWWAQETFKNIKKTTTFLNDSVYLSSIWSKYRLIQNNSNKKHGQPLPFKLICCVILERHPNRYYQTLILPKLVQHAQTHMLNLHTPWPPMLKIKTDRLSSFCEWVSEKKMAKSALYILALWLDTDRKLRSHETGCAQWYLLTFLQETLDISRAFHCNIYSLDNMIWVKLNCPAQDKWKNWQKRQINNFFSTLRFRQQRRSQSGSIGCKIRIF